MDTVLNVLASLGLILFGLVGVTLMAYTVHGSWEQYKTKYRPSKERDAGRHAMNAVAEAVQVTMYNGEWRLDYGKTGQDPVLRHLSGVEIYFSGILAWELSSAGSVRFSDANKEMIRNAWTESIAINITKRLTGTPYVPPAVQATLEEARHTLEEWTK